MLVNLLDLVLGKLDSPKKMFFQKFGDKKKLFSNAWLCRKVSAKSDTSDEGRAGSLSPALPVRRTTRPLQHTTNINNSSSSSNSNNIKKRHNSTADPMGSRRQTDNINLIRKLSVTVNGGRTEPKKPVTLKGISCQKPLVIHIFNCKASLSPSLKL